MDTNEPEQEDEQDLRERIKEQACLIAVALGYLKAEQPELAKEVLEAAKI